MAITAISGVPCSFESGTTVIFTEVFTDYPPSSWAASLILSLNGVASGSFDATESGSTYTFTLSAEQTTALAPGLYAYVIRVTGADGTATAKRGTLSVTPNLAVTQTESTAQQMVDALETNILALAANGNASVSFNGQSFTKRNLAELQQMLVFWQSRLIAERRAAQIAAGGTNSNDVAGRFNNGGTAWPYPPFRTRC